MIHRKSILLACLPAALSVHATLSLAQQPAAEAPAPGSPGVFVSGDQIAEQLKAALAKAADPGVAEIGNTQTYAIHEVHRGKPGPAAVHMGWTELHFILEGGGTLITGGTMSTVTGANSIQNGVSRAVKKGDAVIIPPNTPHMYAVVNGTLVYLEVRFPSPAIPPPAK